MLTDYSMLQNAPKLEGLKASVPAAEMLHARSVPASPRRNAAASARPYSALPTPRVSPQVRKICHVLGMTETDLAFHDNNPFWRPPGEGFVKSFLGIYAGFCESQCNITQNGSWAWIDYSDVSINPSS